MLPHRQHDRSQRSIFRQLSCAILRVGRRAAKLVLAYGIRDQAQRHILVGCPQRLRAHQPAITVVVALSIHDVFEVAVARVVLRTESHSQAIGHHRSAPRTGDNPAVVVAERCGDETFRREGRLLGADIDDACRGVLAEQGGLRAAQHFDLIDVDQIAHGHAPLRAINAIHEHADRAFQPRIVARRTDTAQSNRGSGGLAGGCRDDERGHGHRQRLRIDNARLLEVLARHGSDRERHDLERFRAARGGDRDGAEVLNLFFRLRLARGLRAWLFLGIRRLRRARLCCHELARYQQCRRDAVPQDGLAHLDAPSK